MFKHVWYSCVLLAFCFHIALRQLYWTILKKEVTGSKIYERWTLKIVHPKRAIVLYPFQKEKRKTLRLNWVKKYNKEQIQTCQNL